MILPQMSNKVRIWINIYSIYYPCTFFKRRLVNISISCWNYTIFSDSIPHIFIFGG